MQEITREWRIFNARSCRKTVFPYLLIFIKDLMNYNKIWFINQSMNSVPKKRANAVSSLLGTFKREYKAVKKPAN